MDLWRRSLTSKAIQDGLCFPLLIDITEEAGLPVPNCSSTLPDELKLGIMAPLPAERSSCCRIAKILLPLPPIHGS
ncbi:unnamed protein product [Linum trigynum]|uniref:Uncharacterized protein n=1 Tax=Linum trigynum TaxID=586398 RepID=A0AAV2FV84_9ROSI